MQEHIERLRRAKQIEVQKEQEAAQQARILKMAEEQRRAEEARVKQEAKKTQQEWNMKFTQYFLSASYEGLQLLVPETWRPESCNIVPMDNSIKREVSKTVYVEGPASYTNPGGGSMWTTTDSVDYDYVGYRLLLNDRSIGSLFAGFHMQSNIIDLSVSILENDMTYKMFIVESVEHGYALGNPRNKTLGISVPQQVKSAEELRSLKDTLQKNIAAVAMQSGLIRY